jgi:hypothetical protein
MLRSLKPPNAGYGRERERERDLIDPCLPRTEKETPREMRRSGHEKEQTPRKQEEKRWGKRNTSYYPPQDVVVFSPHDEAPAPDLRYLTFGEWVASTVTDEWTVSKQSPLAGGPVTILHEELTTQICMIGAKGKAGNILWRRGNHTG